LRQTKFRKQPAKRRFVLQSFKRCEFRHRKPHVWLEHVTKAADQVRLLVRGQDNVVPPLANQSHKESQKLDRLFGKRRRAEEPADVTGKAALAKRVGVHHVDIVSTAQRIQGLAR
jgi:hypothetical protein